VSRRRRCGAAKADQIAIKGRRDALQVLGGQQVEQRPAQDRERLWTNHPLAAARKIYLARGFRLTHEEAHRSFGVDLVGQTYELDLQS
jgi:hypothetical protein